jgi:aminoglycoside phosphotransferase (APT) family kinase protein
MPAADVDVTPDLVRRLLAGQHPDLAGLPVEFMANGWDNAMFRVGDELLARLPRREVAAAILLNEQRWLPVLAREIQLPIPAPERTGVPAYGYPYPWSVVPYLPGAPATDADSLDLAGVAADVGGFLGSLHAPAPPEAPAHAGPPVWLHGDLHPANVLVSGGRVSGVIDFGDITAGDPATDLAVAWMLLPLERHATFRAVYQSVRPGPTDPAAWSALWTRARGWALGLAVVFLAHSDDNPQLLTVGRRALAGARLTVTRGGPEALSWRSCGVTLLRSRGVPAAR